MLQIQKKIYLMKSITDKDGFIQINIPPGAYEIKSLNNEIRRIYVNEENYTEANYRFTIQTVFSTLGTNIEFSPQGPTFSFIFNGSFRDLL